MKQAFINIILELSYPLVRIINKIGKQKSRSGEHTYLVITAGDGLRPSEKKSFGDEMMFLSICENILRIDPFATITILRFNGKAVKPYQFYNYTISEIAFPSEDYTSISAYMEFSRIARNFSHVYLMGADCLDGKYGRRTTLQRLRFLNIASNLGLKTRIVGFSYNGNKDPYIEKELIRLSKHSKLCIRDHISRKRISRFVRRNVIEVADMAFIVNADKYSNSKQLDKLCNQIRHIKETLDCQIIAINLCGWHYNNLDMFLDKFAANLIRLGSSNDKIRFLLLPHDNREGKINDIQTLESLKNKLEPVKDKILCADFIKTGVEAKKIVKYADILITGRMHLAIAALSQNVPTLSLIYQGKFEGLYHFYNFDRLYYFSPEKIDDLFAELETLRQHPGIISKQIAERNTSIFELAKYNFG